MLLLPGSCSDRDGCGWSDEPGRGAKESRIRLTGSLDSAVVQTADVESNKCFGLYLGGNEHSINGD